MRDLTVDRLYELTARLKACLVEAEDIRARLTKARDANKWPDLRAAAQLLADYNRRAH